MRSSKGSRRIVFRNVEYRWRATGYDSYISIGIWPANNTGPFIYSSLRYHETWIDNHDGHLSSAGDQIVITNRLIKRIIEHAITEHHYEPNDERAELCLMVIDDVIKWDDAVRATNQRQQ